MKIFLNLVAGQCDAWFGLSAIFAMRIFWPSYLLFAILLLLGFLVFICQICKFLSNRNHWINFSFFVYFSLNWVTKSIFIINWFITFFWGCFGKWQYMYWLQIYLWHHNRLIVLIVLVSNHNNGYNQSIVWHLLSRQSIRISSYWDFLVVEVYLRNSIVIDKIY